MRKVTLKILKDDIFNSTYMDSYDCAITRALKREGLDMKEVGGEIYKEHEFPSGFIVNTPKELSDKVRGMYVYSGDIDGSITQPVEPADFEFELELPD